MAAMRYSLKELAKNVGAQLIGEESQEVSGVASLSNAGSNDLAFVDDPKRLADALSSQAAAIIAGPFANGTQVSTKNFLIHPQPRLAFARIAALLLERDIGTIGVHSTAVVHSSAKLGLGVSVGAHSTIEEGVAIGARTRISAGVHIAARTTLGSDCVLHPNVCIYSRVMLGDRVIVHSGAVLGSDGFGFVRDESTGSYEKFPQIGRLIIGDDVEIGANCTIDRGALAETVISRGTKLDNLVHVGHNVRIGENVVIAAQTGISGSAVIESNTVIAGQVGIADHVTIESGAILGAQCGVPSGKVIRGKGVLFWGTPARPIKQYLKELAALARLARK